MMSSNQRSSRCYSTDYNINNNLILHSLMHKQCHIINFWSLHKNFQEDHLNSRRFPGVVDTLEIPQQQTNILMHLRGQTGRWRRYVLYLSIPVGPPICNQTCKLTRMPYKNEPILMQADTSEAWTNQLWGSRGTDPVLLMVASLYALCGNSNQHGLGSTPRNDDY